MHNFKILLNILLLSTLFINLQAAWVHRDGDEDNRLIDLDVNKNFSILYGGQGTAVLGDFSATGDSNLYVVNPNTDNYGGALYTSDAHYMLTNNAFSSSTSDNRKKNASTASLSLPPYVQAKHIVWAGLFWQGQIHEEIGDGLTTSTVDNRINGWNKINFMTPDGVMHPITAPLGVKSKNSSTYHYGMKDNNSFRYFYGAYADVTKLVKQTYTPSNNQFTVGNILCTRGKDFGDNMFISHAYADAGAWFGGLRMGYFSGWSLVVVYDLTGTAEASAPNEVYKNVSLYNGYDLFLTWSNNQVAPFETTIPLAGFKTPKNGTVASKLLFFGGGADQGINFDTLQIQNKKSNTFSNLSNTHNPSGIQFNNTYTNLDKEIIPNKPYHHGMDLDIFDVSSNMDNDQSQTKIKFGIVKNENVADQIFPQILGFSTKLYTPNLCYDYDVHVGDHIKVPSKNNDVNTSYWGGEPLVIKVFLRSMEADFDLINTRLKVDFTPAGKFKFKKNYATVSPPNINAYLPAIETNTSEISIGKNNSISGGTIAANESVYSKIGFDFLSSSFINSHFELDIKTAIQFDTNVAPIPYTLTTRGDSNTFGHIGLCPRNPVYDPIYGRFNIERGDSKFTQPIAKRYPLYTQITGKNFNVSLASYGGSNLDQKLVIDKTTVDLEIIDAGGFDNNSSVGYDSVCEEPASIGGDGALIHFNNTARKIVDLKTDLPNFKNDLALQSAAFRLWILTKTDNNNTSEKILVKHSCTDKTDENCFKQVYEDNYKNGDDASTHFCATSCGSAPHECYKCLKQYFATPICSRDNFSIRPAGFRVAISDANESNTTTAITVKENTTTNSKPNISLAAGYNYQLDINATRFTGSKVALGYYNNSFQEEANITTLDFKNRIMAPLQFKDKVTCTDTTHRTLGVRMQNGQILANKTFAHNNVGAYEFWMYDINWTNVDQANYPYKTTFDPSCKNNTSDANCNDCILNDARSITQNGKIGCIINSDIPNDNAYVRLPLNFQPYKFGLDSINFTQIPNKNILFMNDFSQSYYTPPLSAKLSMSTSFEGNVTALGKQNTLLTNFTNGCTASDVTLQLQRVMTPAENTLTNVPFQQYLEVGVNIVDTKEGNSTNLTLPKSAFKDIDKGNAFIKLHTTIKKPYGFGNKVNPIQVNYKFLKATDPLASSYAEMTSNYIPDGNTTYDKNTTFVYGKVTPLNRLYNNVEASSIQTPLYVDIYCNDANSSLNAGDCKNIFNLTQDSLGTQEKEGGWKLATIFANNELGTTDLTVSHLAEKNALPLVSVDGGTAKKTIKQVVFNDNQATQNDINVSVTTQARNSMVKVKFDPVPWLIYDPVQDYYRVHFIGPSAWAGVGKTGHVSDTGSSKTQNNRMSW